MGNASLVRALETLGQAVVDMRGTDAADPRLVLEIALVRLARRDTGGPLQVLADRVDRLEQRLNDGATSGPVSAPPPGPSEKSEKPNGRKKPALGAFKKAEPVEATPPPSSEGPPPEPKAETGEAFDLDDVIVAWSTVLDGLPRALRSAVQEAQPLTVEGNVITFGVSRQQMDNVKPRFHKEAATIREKFIEQLGGPPKFKFAVHSWTGDGGGGRARPARPRPAAATSEAEPAPEPEPGPDPSDPGPAEPVIDLVDPDEVVDAPPAAGAAVDSISRLESAFGATVVEERPRT
jgi:hypothetical protein